MNSTLKASWISKIYHNSLWRTSKDLCSAHIFFSSKLYPFFQLKPQHCDWLLEGTLSNISPFFKDALKAWLSFQYYPPDNPEAIQNQVIWMNSELLINGKPFLWETLLENGVIFINDILDVTGDFLAHEQFCRMYGQICDNLNFNQLLSTIPMIWKRKLKRFGCKQQVCAPNSRSHKWLSRKINKTIYNFVLQSRGLTVFPHTICSYWEDEFNTLIPWKQFFRSLYKTIDSYSRIFQLKIFYKITATKKQLTRFNILQPSLCRFCNEEEEDQLHLFFYCPYVANLWTEIQNWLGPLDISFEYTPLIIVLGVIHENSPQVLNLFPPRRPTGGSGAFKLSQIRL